MNNLEQENTFYEAHRDEFREKYYNKYLVIVGEKLHGVFDTFAEAAKTALANYEPCEFLIHRPSDEDRVIEITNIFSETEDEPASTFSYVGGEVKKFEYAC